MKLTVKQKAFCDYYIETGNATESARRAGYKQPQVQGCENLEKPNVHAYIQERMQKIEDARIAKGDEVLRYLTSVMRGEEKDQFGLDPSLKDRTNAAELLGKRYRLFTEKVEVKDESKEKEKAAISNIENMVKQMMDVEEEEIENE